MTPTFLLIGDNRPFHFVVPPLDLKIESGQDITVVKVIDLGEKTIVGKRKVKRISFSTFIPGLKSQFFKITNPVAPSEAAKILDTWKDKQIKVSLIIPEFNIFYKCYIEKLDTNITERNGDIEVSMSLTEQGITKTLIDEVSNLYVR